MPERRAFICHASKECTRRVFLAAGETVPTCHGKRMLPQINLPYKRPVPSADPPKQIIDTPKGEKK